MCNMTEALYRGIPNGLVDIVDIVDISKHLSSSKLGYLHTPNEPRKYE